MIRIFSTFTIVSALMTGCTGQTALEADFGNSTRQLVQNQIANPEQARNPSTKAIDGTDAGRLEGVFETYRNDVSQPSEVNRSIHVGASNSGANK